MTVHPCTVGDDCILVLGHDGDCRYTSTAEDESPLFDRIRPDSDEKTRADGWRYRIRRDAGEMTVVVSEEQVLPEKVGDINANRIRSRHTVLVGGQDVAWFRDTLDELLGDDSLRARLDLTLAEVDRLRAELNTPHTADFLDAVRIEAAHQRERWGVDHDAGKAPEDWFWLLGYLSGKALAAAKGARPRRFRHVKRGTTYEVLAIAENENQRGASVVVYRGEDDGKVWTRPADQFFDGRFEELSQRPAEKLLHHVISSAAVLMNWHAHATGADTRMRPGIAPHAEEGASP